MKNNLLRKCSLYLMLFFITIFANSCSAWDTLKELPGVMDWWEWIVLILLAVFILILILAACGIEWAIAVLAAIIKAIIAVFAALGRLIGWLARFIYDKVLCPLGKWIWPRLAPLWENIKGNVKWDIIKWLLGLLGTGVGGLWGWLFGKGKIKLSCSSSLPMTVTLPGSGSSWCFWKSSLAATIQAAKTEAEANAVKNVNEYLIALADKFDCDEPCVKTVVPPNAVIVPPTTHRITGGNVYYSVSAAANATGTVVINCSRQ
jgi:hypothetical protein